MAIKASDLRQSIEGDLAWLEQMTTKIDHPLFMSLDERVQIAVQIASSMAPTPLGAYAAGLLRPLPPPLPAALAVGLAESWSKYQPSMDMVQGMLSAHGYSLGLLDDLEVSLGRLHERRQAPAEQVVMRRPEPPAEQQVQVVRLKAGDLTEGLRYVLSLAPAGKVLKHMQQLAGGKLSRMPSKEELEAVYLTYQRMRGTNTADSIARHLWMSRATFMRWLRLYRTFYLKE